MNLLDRLFRRKPEETQEARQAIANLKAVYMETMQPILEPICKTLERLLFRRMRERKVELELLRQKAAARDLAHKAWAEHSSRCSACRSDEVCSVGNKLWLQDIKATADLVAANTSENRHFAKTTSCNPHE